MDAKQLTPLQGAVVALLVASVSWFTATVVDSRQATATAKEVSAQKAMDDIRYNDQIKECRASLIHSRDRETDVLHDLIMHPCVRTP